MGTISRQYKKLETALEFCQTDAQIQSQVAWLMLTLPDARFRDIAKAAVSRTARHGVIT